MAGAEPGFARASACTTDEKVGISNTRNASAQERLRLENDFWFAVFISFTVGLDAIAWASVQFAARISPLPVVDEEVGLNLPWAHPDRSYHFRSG